MTKVHSRRSAEMLAREQHAAHQREGHKTPDWDGLSEAMKAELIYRAQQTIDDRTTTPKSV